MNDAKNMEEDLFSEKLAKIHLLKEQVERDARLLVEAVAEVTEGEKDYQSKIDSLLRFAEIKTCENCGKPFIPKNRSDALYCYRPSPQNPDFTCRDYRLKRAWYDKSRTDELERLSKNVYQTWLMRTRRRPNDLSLKSRFKAFSRQRSQWREDVKAGKATEEEFKAWLLKMREEK